MLGAFQGPHSAHNANRRWSSVRRLMAPELGGGAAIRGNRNTALKAGFSQHWI